jgi:hypothetical protein
MTALEAALQYAGRGWSVFSCRDKVPLVRGGVHAATRDLATIERWWHTWPQANVAIACGAPSGIVVIDIDAPSQVPELFNLTTLCASTPSGGRHLYCRYVEGIRNRVFDWGEVRSTGLYVVAPPATGREWLDNSVIAHVPENLAKIVPEAPTVTSLVPSGSWGRRRCRPPQNRRAMESRGKLRLRSVPQRHQSRAQCQASDDRVERRNLFAWSIGWARMDRAVSSCPRHGNRFSSQRINREAAGDAILRGGSGALS